MGCAADWTTRLDARVDDLVGPPPEKLLLGEGGVATGEVAHRRGKGAAAREDARWKKKGSPKCLHWSDTSSGAAQMRVKEDVEGKEKSRIKKTNRYFS